MKYFSLSKCGIIKLEGSKRIRGGGGEKRWLAAILFSPLFLAIALTHAQEPAVPTLGLEVTGLPENSESIFERLQLFLDCGGEEEPGDCLQGLDGPSAAFGGIALSPDGTLLAAAGAGDNALSLWQVDTDGTIARTALYCNAADNCQGGTAVSYGLRGAHDLAFSRDNGLLFVAARGARGARGEGGISVWRVDAEAGALTRTATYWDSGTGGREDGCQAALGAIPECSDDTQVGLVENGGFLADGLNGAYDVAASPTHDLLFVTASLDDALSVWEINPQAGTLIQRALYKRGRAGATSCGSRSGANCMDEQEGLNGVRGVAVSPDGSLVFAAAFDDDALSVWQVAPGASGTGILTRTELYEEDEPELSDVAVSPNGRLVFATDINENSLIVWRVNAESGTLTRTGLYYDTNTSGCTNELREQGNCFDGLTSARNVTLSRDGRLLFVTAVTDDSLSAYEVDYTGGTLRQTALNRVRSDVLTGLNPATGVIVGPFSTVGTATGLLNPAGVAASTAGIVFVKAGAGTAIGALSTWRPIPLVPAYSLVVLTVTADMVPGMPVAATVTAVMQQGSRSVLVPVTLSSTSAEASFPADMLTPGLWDFTVLAAPGAADVALAKASLRAAPLTLRLTREQQGDQVNLRATTVEGAPITTVTVTVDAILRAEAATSASVTFMLSPQNFQDVLAQFPAASLPSGEYGFSITSSPVGIVNTVSTRSPLTVRDYTLSLAAPLEVRATKEFVVTLSAAPALETTLDVLVTLTASEIATQTRSVDLTPAAPSQNLMFTAPDVSIPTTIFLNTVTVAESTAVTGAEADTVDVRVLPPLPRLVLTPSQVGSQLQVQLATARGIPAATVAVTVKAVLRGTGTSETVTITLGPGTDAASAVFPLGALPPGTYDFSITASPPGILDTDTVEGETTPMVVLGASFTLPGGAILPAGSTVSVMITLNGEASISQVIALLGTESGQQVVSENILSSPDNAPVKTAVFSAGMLAPGMWSFSVIDLNIRATSSSPALLIEEPVMVTLVPDTASVSAGAEVRLVVTALSQLAESLGDVLLTVTADGISGLASGRSEMQMLTLSSSITEGAVVFPRLASGRWRISGEDERGAVATTEAEVEVVLSVVSIRPTAPQIDVDGTRQHAVAVGDDVRLQLTADPAPGTEVMLTVSAIPAEGNTGTTMTATAMLSPTVSMAEAVFSGASVLSAGTWQFSAAASLADTLVLQAAPMVEVLVPRITLTQQGGMEVVPVTRPVRLEVASVPLAPGMNVAINVQAMLAESSTSQEIMLSPETASVQVEFTPSMLGQVGEWVFTATTAVPNGFVDISGASLMVTVVSPALLLVPTTEFVSTEAAVQLTVRTDAPIQSTADITVTGMSSGKADVMRTIQLSPGNSEEIAEGLADFGVLAAGEWTFRATAIPQNVVDHSRAEATVTVVESGNILSNVLLVPGQIIQGAAAVLRVVKVGASANTQTFTVLRDGMQEVELIIPANAAEAEVQVRGDGIGEYTYSLGDPGSLLFNEDSETFSQQLRVLANVQLSLAPAVGDIAYVGQASRVSAALVDTDGNAVGLATSVTLSLQAAADSGEVIAGIPLIIAPSATSGAAMFIPTVGATWTVTVRERSPQDALLVPVADIAPAAIVVQDQLRLVLMPATSSILIGSAATLTVMVGTAADVEVTMLEVRAVQNGRPTVSAQPDSLDLPAAVVFGVADLAPGDWELELIAEPAMAIVASTAKITVRDADLDLSTSSGEAGVGADDLVLILRHAVLCQGGSTCPDDIADLVRNLDGVAADYDLEQLPALDVPDVAADGVAEARRDISILLDYLSGIEEEVLFPPPAVSADQRERLRKVIRHILEIEPL